MRKLLLSSSVIVLAAVSSASAQDNQIRVVQPDGTVQVFEIPQPAPPPEEAAPAPEAVTPLEPFVVAPAEPVAEKPKAKKKKAEPKPPPEPTSAESHGRIPAPEAPPPVPEGVEITKDVAVQLALPYAPPAMSLMVVPRVYEGRKVFVVMFKTETGTHDVLVDQIIKPQ